MSARPIKTAAPTAASRRWVPWARAAVTARTVRQGLEQVRRGRAADDAVAVSIGVVLLHSIGACASNVALLHRCGAAREHMRDGIPPSAVAALLDEVEAEAERLLAALGPVS